jgi:hypothetical protein
MSQANGTSRNKERRTLYVNEWPEVDRLAWQEACRPTYRLKKGGSASHLARVSQEEIATRYGQFLGFLKLSGRLDRHAAPAAQVTPGNIEAYLSDLARRKVSSVTVWNCIYKVRRAAQLISPGGDFDWLVEIEKDRALVMQPRSKFDRLVTTERLLEAGLTLLTEAKDHTRAKFGPRRPQRLYAGLARTLPDAAKELCGIGDRQDLQTSKGPMVDNAPRQGY